MGGTRYVRLLLGATKKLDIAERVHDCIGRLLARPRRRGGESGRSAGRNRAAVKAGLRKLHVLARFRSAAKAFRRRRRRVAAVTRRRPRAPKLRDAASCDVPRDARASRRSAAALSPNCRAASRSPSSRSAHRRPPAPARARRPRPIRAGSQVELQQHFPRHTITVLNRGVGGEEVPTCSSASTAP